MPDKGRGAAFNPPNRFEPFHVEPLEDEEQAEDAVPTQLFVDSTRSILARNDSPDLPFTYSINPYRGCEHGCIYCYARPSHEFLGFSAGMDFESKILVKPDAARLLEEALARRSWRPQVVALSGNTDPYQPVERKLRLTRRCLEVFLRFRNPVGIITKSSLISRDLDLLSGLAALNLVHVRVSITTLDTGLARVMEPRAATPARRLETIEILARNGIPVGVNAAPVIPGLTERELPSILRESALRGATTAAWIMVRLPGAVEPLFVEWLRRELPARADRVIHRLREVRGGELSDSRFGSRMRGEGEFAQTVRKLFALACRKYRLNQTETILATDKFRHPGSGQLHLYGGSPR